MTLQEMISDVRARSNQLSSQNITDLLITHWLNEAQQDFARRTLCLSAMAHASTMSGEAFYQLPDNTIKLNEIKCDGAKLPEIPLAQRADGAGIPTAYVQPSQNAIILSPIPDDTYQLEILYYNAPIGLKDKTDVSTLPASTHEALVLYATLRAYEKEPPSEAAIYYTDRLRGAYTSIVKEEASRWRRKKPSQWRVER